MRMPQQIVHSWESCTANEANKKLGRLDRDFASLLEYVARASCP